MDFEGLGLARHSIKAVQEMGFSVPTPIQEKAIPAIIEGRRDLVGLAQTGTGKTAAYGLPLLQLIDFSTSQVQGLILCPTRELCVQISKDLIRYSRYIKGAKIVAIYGGAGIEPQIQQIKKGAQIIVATPGRLLDLIHRGIVNLKRIDYVVLDEADEMLTMGFLDDLNEILSKTPSEKRTWLFSATMTEPVARISRNYMKDPVEITIGRRNSAAGNISHLKYVVMEKNRYPALKRIIDYHPNIFSLVFCRTRRETQTVAEKLIKDGYNAESLHGDLSQTQRDYVMRRFREKSLQILVATDVAARGLDVDDISHVIQYNLPDEPGSYTHRSGRTARAGKSGTSIVLINTRENRKLTHVEQATGVRFQYEKVPSGRAICEKQLYGMVERLVATDINHEEIAGLSSACVRNIVNPIERKTDPAFRIHRIQPVSGLLQGFRGYQRQYPSKEGNPEKRGHGEKGLHGTNISKRFHRESFSDSKALPQYGATGRHSKRSHHTPGVRQVGHFLPPNRKNRSDERIFLPGGGRRFRGPRHEIHEGGHPGREKGFHGVCGKKGG